jgi:hypothetical protein
MGAFIQYSFPQTLSLNDISLRLLSKTHSGEWVITRFDEAQWRDVMMQQWLNKVLGEVIVIYSKVSFVMRRNCPVIKRTMFMFSIGWKAARHEGRRNIRMTKLAPRR